MAGRLPLVIDSDGGIDDAAALWWAATHPGVELVAVTVVGGNVARDLAARNVLAVLEAAGRPDVPVALGEPAPIGPAPPPRDAGAIHGRNGLGDIDVRPPAITAVDEPAAALLRRESRQRAGRLQLVTIGPLSTIGALVREDPAFPTSIAGLTIMGGAFGGRPGLPGAEANIRFDPTAAATVLAAPWRQPPLLVGLDVTTQATMGDREFAALADHRTSAAAFLDQPLRFFRDARGARACPVHDLLAVMAVVEPDVITEAGVRTVRVETADGEGWGATVTGDVIGRGNRAGQCRVATGVDVERFRALVRAWLRDDQHEGKDHSAEANSPPM